MSLQAVMSPHRSIRMIVTFVALTLITVTSVAASPSGVERPSTYPDCWQGSQVLYLECIDANQWGARFVFEAPTSGGSGLESALTPR